MKKSRGQSLMEVAIIGMLAFAFVAIGALFFGDDLANVFAGNNPEARFNTSRTVRYENPEDLISNMEVQFDGKTFKPPIEAILETEGYVQTSGSAGQVAQMMRVVEKYIEQLELIIAPSGTGNTTLWNKLFSSSTTTPGAITKYKKLLKKQQPTDPNGFMDIYSAASDDLERKLALIEMCASDDIKSVLNEIRTAADSYSTTLDGNRKIIFDQYINDLTNILTNIEYSMGDTLYISYLGIDHIPGNTAQDRNLIAKIRDHINAMPENNATEIATKQAEKADIASQLKIYYGGGFSIASPAMYNGRKMCDTFEDSIDSSSTAGQCIICLTYGCM